MWKWMGTLPAFYGPVANELRKHPELLGAAFAYGYLPPANATDDGAMLDYRYIVSRIEKGG